MRLEVQAPTENFNIDFEDEVGIKLEVEKADDLDLESKLG